jgi:subtilisin-like proprotein convertase family protein
MLLAAALVLELARESLTGTHYRYREYVNGVPSDEYITSKYLLPAHGEKVPKADEGLRLSRGRIIRRRIIEESPLEPYAHDYDATTGALLRRTPLFFHAKPARVFDPNPVVALNDPTLRDSNDSASAVPGTAYIDVTLPDQALDGPHVKLVDRQPRDVAPPEGALVFDRDQDGFEDVSAYFHIDRNQRHLQSLGYTGVRAVVPYAIEVDAHAANGADNSFFIPSSTEAGTGTLYFGEGGTDDAEDADLLVHEYAHAVMEWIAPGTFGGSFAGEARAIGEGIGDYWAFSAHVAARRASGRDPYCFADWDARCWQDATSEGCGYEVGSDCLRRLDSTKTMEDYDETETSGVEHRNGAIWSSALREIHEKLGRAITDTVVVESLFGAPPRPTFAVMTHRLLEADRLLYQGVHADVICSAMFARGIVTQCDLTPRGGRTLFQSTTHDVPIPENSPVGVTSTITITDARAIEQLFVRVDVEHPSRGDLRVELTAPDGTVILLHQLSSARTPNIHVSYGLTAVPFESLDVLRGRSAAGVWTLFVADRRPRDAGSFQSWGLEIVFAGDEPQTTRPHDESAQMIPVIANLFGQNGRYVSDLRLANPNDTARGATLIFTRSGEDGRTRFAAVQVSLAPRQTIAFDDVVERTFHTFGSGTLEVLGDVIVTSRINGQQVPPNLDTTTFNAPPLLVASMTEDVARFNFGLAETAGARGVVRVGERELTIEPFSHVQVPAGPEFLEVRVVEGDARVAAYISQIGEDEMFIPAETAAAPRTRIAPVITTQTSDEPLWRSDLWLGSRIATQFLVEAIPGGIVPVTSPNAFEDVLALMFHRTVTFAALRVTLPEGVVAATRIVTPGTTQFVPFVSDGPSEQHLLFIESSDTVRTNIGIVAAVPSSAEVIVYDASGTEVERHTLATSGGIAQVRVNARVANGRAVVRFTNGVGRAYASVIGQGGAGFQPAQSRGG